MANTINIGVQAQTSEANKSLKSLEKVIDELISELKKLIDEQQTTIINLTKENAEIKAVLESTFIYNWVDDNMPDWAKPAVIAAMNCGAIKGDEQGKLNLNYKDLRNIVREYRQGLYDKPVVHK